jgi:hypothetical protein
MAATQQARWGHNVANRALDHQARRVPIARISMVCELSPFCWWSVIHAQPWLVPGGFIGLIFFSLFSGFLITRIILSQLKANTFSFIEFYSRRIRRIFPALIVVLAVTYLIGWFVLLPDGFSMLGESIAAGVRVCIQSVSTQAGRLFCAGRGRKSSLASLVVGYLRNSSTFSGRQLFCWCSGRSDT